MKKKSIFYDVNWEVLCLLERNGDSIEVESQVGKDSTFTIRLSMADSQERSDG